MSSLAKYAGLEPGDHVYLGEPRPTKVTWRITSIHRAAPEKVYATIKSGNFERSRVVPIETLVLHTKGRKK